MLLKSFIKIKDRIKWSFRKNIRYNELYIQNNELCVDCGTLVMTFKFKISNNLKSIYNYVKVNEPGGLVYLPSCYVEVKGTIGNDKIKLSTIHRTHPEFFI